MTREHKFRGLPEARKLEEEAKASLKADPERAIGLYLEAAEIYAALLARNSKHAHAAARYLVCLRKARIAPDDALVVARQLGDRFRDDKWVRLAHAWIATDAGRGAVARHDLDATIACCSEAAEALGCHNEPKKLAEAIFRLISESCPKASTSEDRETADPRCVKLVDFFKEYGPTLMEALDPQPVKTSKGKLVPSQRERGYAVARRAASGARDGDLLEKVCTAGRAEFPRNEQLMEGHIQAAFLAGNDALALERSLEAHREFPSSWPIARAHAEAQRRSGDVDGAIKTVETLCLQARSPWPWKHLADMFAGAERPQDAAAALSVALGSHDPKDPGKVWRLHLELSRLLHAAGDAPGAAVEAWLAKDAREGNKLKLTAEQKAWQDEHPEFAEAFAEHDALESGTTRKAAVERYSGARDAYLESRADEGTVSQFYFKKGFGFVRTEGRGETYFRAAAVTGGNVSEGAKVRAVIVDAWDPKKKRESREAVWIKVTEEGIAAMAERLVARAAEAHAARVAAAPPAPEAPAEGAGETEAGEAPATPAVAEAPTADSAPAQPAVPAEPAAEPAAEAAPTEEAPAEPPSPEPAAGVVTGEGPAETVAVEETPPTSPSEAETLPEATPIVPDAGEPTPPADTEAPTEVIPTADPEEEKAE